MMKKKLYDLTIDPELQDLIPPLSDEEHSMLEDSIVRDGCDTPLTVWNGIIVDGHNRYEICHAHNIAFGIEEKDFPDKDAVMFWMLEHQLARRNLNSYQRSEVALKYEHYYREQAKRRLATSTGGKDARPLVNLPEAEKGNALDKLGKMVGVSRRTLEKVKKLDTDADSETKQQLRKGEVSIHRAFTEMKNREHEGETRICECCGQEKPYSDYRIPSNRKGYCPICKDCETKAKHAAKEAEKAAVQPPTAAPASLSDVPVSVSGIAVKDGKLAHVMTGLPDDPAAFEQVVHMLQSAQNYYIAAFKGIIEQYKPAMITQKHNEQLQSMLDSTADTIDDIFTDHIKEDM